MIQVGIATIGMTEIWCIFKSYKDLIHAKDYSSIKICKFATLFPQKCKNSFQIANPSSHKFTIHGVPIFEIFPIKKFTFAKKILLLLKLFTFHNKISNFHAYVTCCDHHLHKASFSSNPWTSHLDGPLIRTLLTPKINLPNQMQIRLELVLEQKPSHFLAVSRRRSEQDLENENP